MIKNSEFALMQQLSKEFGIAIWENSLQIPDDNQKEANSFLMKKFFFTWVEKEQKVLFFVSIESQLAEIFQFSCLFDKPVIIYLTSTPLIKEKIAELENTNQQLDNNYISSFLQELLEFACQIGATDIHIEPTRKGDYKVQLRKDGKLQVYKNSAPKETLLKIKLLSKMDIATTRFPQDGHMNFTGKLGKKFDLRVSTLPAVIGEKMVIRILPLENLEIDLSKLNFSSDFVNVVKKVIRAQSGWLLVAGPTGSGKTTTLYSIVRELLKRNLNIITVEDPVEYHMEGVTQVEVKEKIGLSFANILRSSLRQDPDVILVGEIRDEETAKIASSAAKTGHLVLATVHSGSVLETIQRLNFLKINSEDLASSLKLIVAQRLLFLPKKKRRFPVIEYLENNAEIRSAILESKPVSELESIMKKNNFLTLQENAEKLGVGIWE
jgi:type II secretory ATPase GspE/PulE/Tfp pilus assembly ATPase PilB-like protein